MYPTCSTIGTSQKYISTTYIPPPPPICPTETSPANIKYKVLNECHCPTKSNQNCLNMNCIDIPSVGESKKVSKCPPVPKFHCFTNIPKIECPPIHYPPVNCCPIEVTFDQKLPAGSCNRCNTLERESNTVSLTTPDGKTIILCSEGFERKAKFVTQKDSTGMSHTYCKEFETRNNFAKSNVRNQKPCITSTPK